MRVMSEYTLGVNPSYRAALQPYTKDIFIILLTRLNGSKTEVLAQRFVRFFYFLAGKEETGPDFIVNAIDAVQSGIFGELYTAVVLPDTAKLNRAADRRVAVAGLTKLVGSSEGLATAYHKAWPNTVITLLKVLEVDPVIPKDDPLVDLQAAEIDDVGFGASFVRLNTCRRRAEDPFPEIVDSRKYVGQKLKEANAKAGGRIEGWISTELGEQARTLLKRYMEN